MSGFVNPFSAARFAPGVLPWIGDLDPLVDRVCIRGVRLQILGPHGSGKSSLLVHLARLVRARGLDARAFRGSQGLRALDRSPSKQVVVFADEAEELGAVRFAALRAWCAVRSAGLVVTAHCDLGLDTLCERSVEASTVRSLVERMLGGADPLPSLDDIEDLLARHSGNVREVFFELYDRRMEPAH